MRNMAACIANQPPFRFGGAVIMTITDDGILRNTIFLCHSNGKGTSGIGAECGTVFV
jgi:hypothetical protein